MPAEDCHAPLCNLGRPSAYGTTGNELDQFSRGGMMYWVNHMRDLLVLALGGLFTTSVAFAALWMKARERAVRAESLLEGARLGATRSDSSGIALDAIAEEVERIGEGQRFLTRVMSEQANRSALPGRSAGSVTPH